MCVCVRPRTRGDSLEKIAFGPLLPALTRSHMCEYVHVRVYTHTHTHSECHTWFDFISWAHTHFPGSDIQCYTSFRCCCCCRSPTNLAPLRTTESFIPIFVLFLFIRWNCVAAAVEGGTQTHMHMCPSLGGLLIVCACVCICAESL